MSNGDNKDTVAGSEALPVIDTDTGVTAPEPASKLEGVDCSSTNQSNGQSDRLKFEHKPFRLLNIGFVLSIIVALALIVRITISSNQTSDLISNEELKSVLSEQPSPFLIEDGTANQVNKDEPVDYNENSFNQNTNIAAEKSVPVANHVKKDELPNESGCQSVHSEDPLCQYDVPFQDKSKASKASASYVTHVELNEYKSHVDQSLQEIVDIISPLSEQLSSAQIEITTFKNSSRTLQHNGQQVQSALPELKNLASKVKTLESDLTKLMVASKVSAKLKSSHNEVPIPPLRFLILEMFEKALYATFSTRDALVIMEEGERFEGWLLIKAIDNGQEQVAILEHIESGHQHTFKAKY